MESIGIMSERFAIEAFRWIEQLECARRYHRRFERLTRGTPWKGITRAEALDDVFTFFVHCYHVKDWVKRCAPYLNLSEADVEEFVTETPALALCADICNARKHLVLMEPRSEATHSIVETTVFFEFERTGEDSAMLLHKVRVTIEHGGRTIDGFDLATEAMKAWDSLLQPRLRELMMTA